MNVKKKLLCKSTDPRLTPVRRKEPFPKMVSLILCTFLLIPESLRVI